MDNNSKKYNNWLFLIAALLVILLGFMSTMSRSFLIGGGLVALVLIWQIFKRPFLGILLIAFFLPLERLGAYETDWGTLRLSQVFLAVTLIAWLWQMLVRKKIVFKQFPILLPLTVFILVNIVGLIWAENLLRSFFVLAVTAFTALSAWLVTNLVTDKAKLKKIIIIILVSSTLVSIFGLYQFMGDMMGLPHTITGLRQHYTKDVLGFTRIQSTALEPLYFANYLLIPLSVIYALFLSRFWQTKRWLMVILILLLGINLFLTISRGGYLALLAAFLVITFLYFRNFFTWKKIVLFIVIVLVLYYLGVQFLQIGGGALNWETFTQHVSGVFSGPSFVERIDTFEKAYQAFVDNPIFGIGPGSFGPYVATFTHIMPEGGWQIVNNEFLELLTETGLLGFLSVLVILVIIFVRSIKAIKKTKDNFLKAIIVGLLGAFIGVVVQYQTFSTFYIMHVWFLFGLIIACQNIILRRDEKTN